MKLSNHKGAGAALFVAAGGLLFFAWHGNRPAAEALPLEPTAVVVHGAAQRPRRFTEIPRDQPPGAANQGDPQAPAQDDETTSDDYEDNSMGDILHTILVNDKRLDTYMYYHNRPLLDEESRVQYHQILSDPTMFASVKEDLLYPEEKKESPAGNIKRLMKIDYLRDALEWKENPNRETILALITEMILTDNYPAGMTMDMRISLSGNKMELYELLSQEAPDSAAALLSSAKGTRLEAMLAFIADSLETRKQLERNLENQVTL
jgi:hypothetical protein